MSRKQALLRNQLTAFLGATTIMVLAFSGVAEAALQTRSVISGQHRTTCRAQMTSTRSSARISAVDRRRLTPPASPSATAAPVPVAVDTPVPVAVDTPVPVAVDTPVAVASVIAAPSPLLTPLGFFMDKTTSDGVVGLYVGTISNISYWSPALPQLKAGGFGSIRVFLTWSAVETAPGAYSWANVDKVMQLAESNGLRVEFAVNGTPAWAQAGTADAHRGPDDPARLQQFTNTVCSRYVGRISSLQVWNEPNATAYFLPYPGMTLPQSYVRLLKAVYTGAKAADPGVAIIGGNMDGRFATDLSVPAYAQDDFTSAVYAAGGKGYFDVWATHNYPGFPSSRVPEFKFGSWAGGRSVWGVVETIRTIMNQNGDADKRLAISEVGWLNSGTPASSSATPSLATQRRYTVRHIVHALEHGVRSYQVMFVKDFTGNAKGVFNSDFTPRPVFTAMKTLNVKLAGTTYAGRLAIGSNDYAYRFLRADGRSVIVAWTTAGEYITQSSTLAAAVVDVSLPLAAGATYDVVSMDGAATGTIAGSTRLRLTNDPVFLVQR